MDSIVWHVTYSCKAGMAEPFVRAMKESGLQAAVRKEDGCLQYDYHLSCEKADTVLLIEHWRDQAAVKQHGASENMAKIKELKGIYVDHTEIVRYE